VVISRRSLVPIDLADKSARSAGLSHAPTGTLRHSQRCQAESTD
jgi:hypothetical protein